MSTPFKMKGMSFGNSPVKHKGDGKHPGHHENRSTEGLEMISDTTYQRKSDSKWENLSFWGKDKNNFNKSGPKNKEQDFVVKREPATEPKKKKKK